MQPPTPKSVLTCTLKLYHKLIMTLAPGTCLQIYSLNYRKKVYFTYIKADLTSFKPEIGKSFTEVLEAMSNKSTFNSTQFSLVMHNYSSLIHMHSWSFLHKVHPSHSISFSWALHMTSTSHQKVFVHLLYMHLHYNTPNFAQAY